jgi:hypothetical protein
MSPETFIAKLEKGLQTGAQPNLMLFLRSNMSTLREVTQNDHIPARYTEVIALKSLMKAEGLEIMTGQSSNNPAARNPLQVLAEDMGGLLKRDQLTDLVLVASDGRELAAHRAILAARSDVNYYI